MKTIRRHNIGFKFTAFLMAGLLYLAPIHAYAVTIGGFADLRGWAEGFGPKKVLVPVTGGPVLADVDCDYDEHVEVLACGYDQEKNKSIVCLWTQYGVMMPGWPKELEEIEVSHNPVVGDLDGDGDLEIVVSGTKIPEGNKGSIYVWHHDGSLYNGYPLDLDYKPGAPLVGDVTGGFSEELIVHESGMAICDIDMDGKKEVIVASPSGLDILNEDDIPFEGWPVPLSAIGSPVAGDVDGDGKPEVFLAVKTPDANYIYGWRNNGDAINGWPVNIAGVVNTPGNFLSLGDIDGDGIAEILSGSVNSWIAGWRINGTVAFSKKVSDEEAVSIYQPIIGNVSGDSSQEIIATSSNGKLYIFDNNGSLLEGYPKSLSENSLSQSCVLFEQDLDGKVELMVGTSDNKMYMLDLAGDYNPNNIQWGMHGFDSRNTKNYLRDWDTSGWSVFDDEPKGAKISSIYDWNKGSRVIELKGAGVNNCYVYKKPDGKPFNSKNTTLQWSMRYGLPSYIYVSIDTIKGKRYLYYSATEGDELADKTGKYIHHGLGGNAKNSRWHTFSRQLVKDLKDAQPDNEIVDINAVYIQGSGRIDDIMLLPGLSCVDIVNLASNAEVKVSSGDNTKDNINDGDPNTKWVSGDEDISWVEYKWDNPQKVNKLIIEAVEGAKSGVVFITDSKGNIYEIDFKIPQDGGPIVLVFDSIDDVKGIVVVFDNEDGPVSVGEVGVYYDPNVEQEKGPPQEEYSADKYIKIKDGYFFDPVKKQPWLPHGIGYQTWNKALGQWQSPAELKNDLDKMIEIGANALRVDFVWKHIETEDGVYDWSRYDMLLEEAQARGLRVFPIIGYQWPPDWFKPEWYTMHPQNEKHPDGPWLSDILSYEAPVVREQFRDFLQAVVKRYSVGGDREDLGDVISGWILGNEYGYLGLWSVEYDGYDPDCQAAFRAWLSKRYNNDIDALNAKWAKDNIQTPGYLPNCPYNSFDDVDMPIPFGYQGETKGKYLARDKASWYDLTEWREESIAGFVAFAAQSVKDADPGHLITYAAVGMQWGEEDWRYHTEDARKIAGACKDIDVPLDFWSINNYPWGLENSELMTGQWGIERAKNDTQLPVMVTETGFTSTETMYPGIDTERQGRLVRNAIWEALESGAVGVCVFHWNDREEPGLTQREKGFGVVTLNKDPKPAYFFVKEAFKKMDEIDIGKLLVGSIPPKPDMAFLWDDATDSIINRYEAEMKELFGTLERLGYESIFINDKELENYIILKPSVIILPRNQKMFDSTFDLLDDINSAGKKIHADSDIPGIMNEYGEPRDKDLWLLTMKALFGIDAANCKVDPDLEDNIYYDGYEMSSFWPINWSYKPKTVYYPDIGFSKTLNMWKYRDKISLDGGIAKAVFDEPDGPPALVFNNDTAISLFSLGDCKPIDNVPYGDWTWSDRYDWLKMIYMDPAGFNIQPELIVSNKYVLVDYRRCADGSVLLSFKNYKPDSSENVEVTTDLIAGKTVKDILTDAIVEDPCDGTIARQLEPDGHDLVLAYSSDQNEQDFYLDTAQSSKSVDPGKSTFYEIDIKAINQFNLPVEMIVFGLPVGVTGLFSINPVIPDGSTVLNISTFILESDAPVPGTYNLTVKGIGGAKSHSISLELIINEPKPKPDFKLEVEPLKQTINQGESTSYTIKLTSMNQFNAPVKLSLLDLPDGVTGAFLEKQIIPDGSTTLNISTAVPIEPKEYKFKVKGAGGGKTHTKTVTLVVNTKPQVNPDFEISVTPTTQTIKQGESTSYTVEITPKDGFNDNVALSATGLPEGATGEFTANPIKPGESSSLNITTLASIKPESYEFNIKGSGGEKTHEVKLKLEINEVQKPQVNPDFEISVTPTTQTIKQGESTSYTVEITPKDGFNDNVALSATGLPEGATGEFTANPIKPGESSNLLVSTLASIKTGSCEFNIEGAGGEKTHEVKLKLEINEAQKPQVNPDFEISTGPTAQTIKQGESTSYTVKLTSVDQFNSAVTLSVSDLPEGATSSFNINPFVPPGSATLSISTTGSVTTGTHNLKIEGSGGGKSHSSSATLIINTVQPVNEDDKDDQGDKGDQGKQDNQDSQNNQQQIPPDTSSSSTNNENQSSVSQSADNTSSDVADTEDSSSSIGGPASVIILEKEKKEETKSHKQTGTGVPGRTAVPTGKPGKRTYVGEGYKKGGGSGEAPIQGPGYLPEQPVIINEIPPIEQFREIMERSSDKETGVIRVKPQIVPQTRLEEAIRIPPTQPRKTPQLSPVVGSINNWLNKFKDWWEDLFKNMRLVYKNISRRYA